jgi:hypothetical protein
VNLIWGFFFFVLAVCLAKIAFSFFQVQISELRFCSLIYERKGVFGWLGLNFGAGICVTYDKEKQIYSRACLDCRLCFIL